MATKASMIMTIVLLAVAGTGNANFLAKNLTKMKQMALSQASIEQRFLEEVRGLTGKGPSDLQLPAIKAALEPMWLALPKNEYGGLDNGKVRYALHRLFVQRHGWHIDGLTGATNDESSPAGIMRDRVPGFIMELFEEAFGATGLKLDELTIFAATLERLIHDETIDRLKDVYGALGLSLNDTVDEADGIFTMHTFMMSLVMGQEKVKGSNRDGVRYHIDFLERSYPAWGEAKAWLKQTLENAVMQQEAPWSFEQMERAAEEAAMTFGKFLDRSCLDIKNAILESEEKGTGRVLLSNFYKKGTEKGMLFREKPEYLRQLGALDETLKGEPRMIVANYMTSPTNCLVETGFYNVCCLNECEGVIAQLESAIGAPQAPPSKIADIVSGISTSTVEARKALPPAMLEKLQSAAERNGGQVPLYGRLFSQWLHFVFPRECPYPHTSGSTNPLTGADYFKQTAERSSMKKDELAEMMAKLEIAQEENGQEEIEESDDDILKRWSDEEEVLFLPVNVPATIWGRLGRLIGLLAIFGGIVLAIAEGAKRFGLADPKASAFAMPEKAHML